MNNLNNNITISVGMGTCGISAGAESVYIAIEKEIGTRKDLPPIILKFTGCSGACYAEVLVEIVMQNTDTVLYGNISDQMISTIFDMHIERAEPVWEWALTDKGHLDNIFFERQERVILERCGKIDPESIEDYKSHRGYEALIKVISGISGDDVISEISRSGLRGRGGAGFHTATKWRLIKDTEISEKYVICNADEGDPGAFMDRNLLESDPHSVIEGMLIAGYAIGSSKGVIYTREEYHLVKERLRIAIQQARENNILGKDILGSGFDFDISIKEGAGAFVCGEETALIRSIEGERGLPTARPPYPVKCGLWGRPSLINSVETFSNVTAIMLKGADEFLIHGRKNNTGTKIFAVAGDIKRGGIIEVPMGISIREVIYDICGGSGTGRKIKAVQLGGPSGGVIPQSLFDIGIDYDQLNEWGAIMGSGGLVVMDQSSCMVDIAKYFLEFTQNESCGKCTFCRLGTRRMYEILDRITSGKGKYDDIANLEDLAEKVKHTSLCGLGKTAPTPVLTTLRYFRHEYEEHICNKRCAALKCRELLEYTIDMEMCEGCTVCMARCAVKAIFEREDNISLKIDREQCIHCGGCFDVCHFDAVQIFSGHI